MRSISKIVDARLVLNPTTGGLKLCEGWELSKVINAPEIVNNVIIVLDGVVYNKPLEYLIRALQVDISNGNISVERVKIFDIDGTG